MGSVNVRQHVSSLFAALSSVAPSAAALSAAALSAAALSAAVVSIAASLLVGCGSDDGDASELSPGAGFPGDPTFPATLDECGASLNVLLDADADGDANPRLDASYSEALASWSFPDEYCGLGIFRGVCADGKRVLYRNGGFTSEIRYYDGERLVGYVGSGDVGICPSVCPFSRFFGTAESVRCEAPSFEALCDSVPAPADGAAVWMPFANGQAPGGCDR